MPPFKTIDLRIRKSEFVLNPNQDGVLLCEKESRNKWQRKISSCGKNKLLQTFQKEIGQFFDLTSKHQHQLEVFFGINSRYVYNFNRVKGVWSSLSIMPFLSSSSLINARKCRIFKLVKWMCVSWRRSSFLRNISFHTLRSLSTCSYTWHYINRDVVAVIVVQQQRLSLSLYFFFSVGFSPPLTS